ncbi:MAG: hypothetical protein U0270_06315 [Labilithrix sp.]
MGGRRWSVIATALLLAGACGLPSADEFASGSPDGGSSLGDVARADGGVTKDAETLTPNPTDGGTDGASAVDSSTPIVNLLAKNNADFEAGCTDSGGYEAVISGSNVARSGAQACNVCRGPNATTEIWSIDNGYAGEPAAGQEYRSTVWVRRPPGSTDALYVTLVLRSQTKSYARIEVSESAPLLLTDEWQMLSVTFTLTKPANNMDTYTYAENGAGLTTACFLIDDYVVWRTR